MNTNTPLKIVIAESSVIIRSGLAVVLRRLPNLSVQPVEIATPESLTHYMQMHTPDIVIANPNFGGWFDLITFKAAHEKSGIRYMALISSVTDPNMLKAYDGHFSICDDLDTIAAQINQILHTEEPEEEKKEPVKVVNTPVNENPQITKDKKKGIIRRGFDSIMNNIFEDE